jgi:hypothetical protein
MKAGRNDLKIKLMHQVMPNLVEEDLVIPWLKNSGHIHCNGKLLMGMDGSTGEVDEGPDHLVRSTKLNLKIRRDEGLRVNREVCHCGGSFDGEGSGRGGLRLMLGGSGRRGG